MISIDQWDDLVFPDNVSLQRTVNDVLENFRQAKETISKIQIRDEISNSSTKLFDEFDIEILNNAFNDRSNEFNGLIEKKANESLRMSMYIKDLAEYFKEISQKNTSVDVILETLSTSLDLAKERKSIAEKLKDDFNQFIIPGFNYFGIAIADPPLNNKEFKRSRRKATSFNIILLLCALSIFAIAYIFPIYIDNAISKFGDFSNITSTGNKGFNNTTPTENGGSGDKADKSGIPHNVTENWIKNWAYTFFSFFYFKSEFEGSNTTTQAGNEGHDNTGTGNECNGNINGEKETHNDTKPTGAESCTKKKSWFGNFLGKPEFEGSNTTTQAGNEGSGNINDEKETHNDTKPTEAESCTKKKSWFGNFLGKPEFEGSNTTTQAGNEGRANTKDDKKTPPDDVKPTKTENCTKKEEKEILPNDIKPTEIKGHNNNTSQNTTDQSTEEKKEKEKLLRCNEIINNKLPAIATNADILYQFWEQIIPILESHIEALESVNGQTDIKLPQLYVRIKEKWLEEENNCKSSYYALKNSVAKNGLMFNETNNSN
ncbi:14075_t:CDS:2 [Entrophospora sp. SA101]|nr:14075_t:CDS:2 [Entrophospora sp. SA101]